MAPLKLTLWIFPIDIDTIETIIKDQPRSRLGKSVTSSIRACSLGEIGRQGPTSDGEKDLELAVLLFEEEQLFDAAIYVVSGFIPGITRIVFVDIREWISQKHFSRIGSDIGEGVENMSQFVRGKVESMVVALIDCPIDKVCDRLVTALHVDLTRILGSREVVNENQMFSVFRE
jgi:hypothetical protein